MTTRVFGVRHHGPGSARSLRSVLHHWRPDVVLIEGPPEADAIVNLAVAEGMEPPVAMLAYVPDQPRRAAWYPFAVFSPEWQAIVHALDRAVPVRFIDLPAANFLAGEDPPDPARAEDPLGELAHAAGYADAERWWEDMVEHRRASPHSSIGDGDLDDADADAGAGADAEVFVAVAEAMTAIREDADPPLGREAQREAAMRQRIRAAEKEGFERIAVVCGAWHVPALISFPSASADAAVLKGLPKVKVATTWVPWTHQRLAAISGYGAGVESPGWYHHLFTVDQNVVEFWLVKVARMLREEDLATSSASVIDGVRLADSLATLRGRPLAGLDELHDATRASLCNGVDAPMALVARRLVVGDVLGQVPDDTPMVPLAQDLARTQRRLRLKPEALTRDLDLDLRRPNDLERSHLLHRLLLLDVPWGQPSEVGGKSGTFHEVWQLTWEPELVVRVVEASRWGVTIMEAAATAARAIVDEATDLETVTEVAERCLLADLPEAVGHVMHVLADRVAVDHDVARLMDALPPLVRVLRYGNVRRTDTTTVTRVVDALVPRICLGLPLACASLDDEAAAAMLEKVVAVHGSLTLVDRPDLLAAWVDSLRRIADQSGMHGVLAGRACRLLLDRGAFSSDEAGRRMAVALSVGTDHRQAAAWADGFLAGSGAVLVHDRALLAVLDRWVAAVRPATFDEVLPLLRRTFSTFAEPERRQVGQQVARMNREGGEAVTDPDSPWALDHDVDLRRAEAVLPIVARLLGLDDPS